MTRFKECFKCKKSLPLSEFYRHKMMVDGHLNKCKECAKSDVAKHRAENIESIREYDRERGRRPERITSALEQVRKWRGEDRRRAKCHSAVARALSNGLIEPEPCTVCGSEKSVAHHEDYDKPLDVIWLCQVHHKARHKEMK